MKDFINHQDDSKWTVAAVQSDVGYTALRVSVDGEPVNVEEWNLSTTGINEEITLNRGEGDENICLLYTSDAADE